MDLSYVTERILALSFDADVATPAYRDALAQAANMLNTKHGDHYMVIQLNFILIHLSCVLPVAWD